MTSALAQMADMESSYGRYRRPWMDRLRRARGQSGQALIEYAFLFILLATISIAVVFLAGTQVRTTLNDVNYDIAHMGMTDTITVAPHACTEPGETAIFRHGKWRCRDE